MILHEDINISCFVADFWGIYQPVVEKMGTRKLEYPPGKQSPPIEKCGSSALGLEGEASLIDDGCPELL